VNIYLFTLNIFLRVLKTQVVKKLIDSNSESSTRVTWVNWHSPTVNRRTHTNPIPNLLIADLTTLLWWHLQHSRIFSCNKAVEVIVNDIVCHSLICRVFIGDERRVDGENCFSDCQPAYQSTRIRPWC